MPMALLKTDSSDKRESLRVFPVTVKLTDEERKAVTERAESRGIARGQWMRDVLLAELARESKGYDIVLPEVLGVGATTYQ
jgi:hypothetical protein